MRLPIIPMPVVAAASFFGWRAIDVVTPEGYNQRHLVPTNDIRPHQACETCECGPVEDMQAPDNWAHNSWDKRELAHFKH